MNLETIANGTFFTVPGTGHFAEGRVYQKVRKATYFQVFPRDMFCGRPIKNRQPAEMAVIVCDAPSA